MALKDVKRYYLQIQADYLKSVKDLNEFQKYIGSGVTQEQVDNINNIVSRLKENYDRISYIMYLFNLPRDKKSRVKSDSNVLEYLNQNNASGDRILDENQDVLKELRKYIESCKEK